MNKQEFENIAQGITPIDAATIMDLQQMQKDFPFFSLPFCFLAKHYHSKQDFRTDNVLHQAAMRVHNRQWLFDYIHNINYTNQSDSNTASNTETEVQNADVEIFTTIENEDFAIEELSQITEPQDILPEIPSLQNTGMDIETEVEMPKDALDLILETDATNQNSIDEIEIEIDSQDAELMLNKVHSELNDQPEIEDLDILELHDQDISLNEIHTATIEEPVEFNVTEDVVSDVPEIKESAKIEFNNPTWGLFTPDEPENQIKLLFEPIFEHKNPSIGNSEMLITNRMSIYNIEDFYPVSEEIKNTPIAGDASSDFYSWLNTNAGESEAEQKPIERKIDLIERFIQTSPSISRPKKEFYTPEKAMKKSEQLPGGLVTETLANIYVKQGRPEKAIEAYSQLQLKIPQKKAYFADLIQKIKEENNLS